MPARTAGQRGQMRANVDAGEGALSSAAHSDLAAAAGQPLPGGHRKHASAHKLAGARRRRMGHGAAAAAGDDEGGGGTALVPPSLAALEAAVAAKRAAVAGLLAERERLLARQQVLESVLEGADGIIATMQGASAGSATAGAAADSSCGDCGGSSGSGGSAAAAAAAAIAAAAADAAGPGTSSGGGGEPGSSSCCSGEFVCSGASCPSPAAAAAAALRQQQQEHQQEAPACSAGGGDSGAASQPQQLLLPADCFPGLAAPPEVLEACADEYLAVVARAESGAQSPAALGLEMEALHARMRARHAAFPLLRSQLLAYDIIARVPAAPAPRGHWRRALAVSGFSAAVPAWTRLVLRCGVAAFDTSMHRLRAERAALERELRQLLAAHGPRATAASVSADGVSGAAALQYAELVPALEAALRRELVTANAWLAGGGGRFLPRERMAALLVAGMPFWPDFEEIARALAAGA